MFYVYIESLSFDFARNGDGVPAFTLQPKKNTKISKRRLFNRFSHLFQLDHPARSLSCSSPSLKRGNGSNSKFISNRNTCRLSMSDAESVVLWEILRELLEQTFEASTTTTIKSLEERLFSLITCPICLGRKQEGWIGESVQLHQSGFLQHPSSGQFGRCCVCNWSNLSRSSKATRLWRNFSCFETRILLRRYRTSLLSRRHFFLNEYKLTNGA